jgi:putative hydrolase of the HAD superfamily
VTVRAVTLDFWGTLLYDPPASDERYKRRRLTDFASVLSAAGVTTSMRALDRAYEASGSTLGRLWRQNRDVPVEGHVRAILDAVDPKLGDRLDPLTMTALIRAYSVPAVAVPPAVDESARAALEALKARGYMLAIVSNTMRTPGAMLRKILEFYGLLPCLTVATFSDECGIRKPDPEIFHLTLRAAGVPAEEAVHVGDDPTLDVQGARAAGMRVIQVTTDPPAAGAAEPDAMIRRLADLPDAVARLDRAP